MLQSTVFLWPPFAAALLLVASGVISAQAQDRGGDRSPNPFSIADELVDRFLPAPTEEDEDALASITVLREEETQLGKSMVKTYLASLKDQKTKVIKKGKEVSYVRALVGDLQSQMENANRYSEIDVFVVDSPIPDARSFPGGTLFFYRGLFEIARSEAALVGVIGHELSHLDRGHQLIPLKRTRLMEQSFSQPEAFEPRKYLETGTRMARLLSRPFRPQDEATADMDAVRWMYAAGYDPREFAELLVRLQQRLAAQENLPLPDVLRTHPPTLERAEAVRAQLEKLQAEDPKRELYIGHENLRRRVTRAEKLFDE